MGGIVKGLFGGSDSKSQQSSSNQAWGVLKDPLSGMAQQGANTFNTLTSQLGQGFDAFKKNSGFDFQLNQGNRAIAGGAAANGLLNSGATAKALAKYETNLGSTMYGNWLDKLSSAVGLGNQAGGVLSSAGGISSGTSNTNDHGKGILGTLFG